MNSIVDYYVNLPAQVKSTIIITTVLCILITIIGIKIKKYDFDDKTPLWFTGLEIIVNKVNNLVKENLGIRWKIFAPYILTVAMFLVFANTASLFSLTPPTTLISINAGLAFLSFLMVQITGIISLGVFKYIKKFFSPFFLLAIINIISEVTFPLSLSLRLFGNIVSGEILGIFIIENLGYLSIVVMPLFSVVFNIAFALIQVLIFVNLTVIFSSMNLDEEDKYIIEE